MNLSIEALGKSVAGILAGLRSGAIKKRLVQVENGRQVVRYGPPEKAAPATAAPVTAAPATAAPATAAPATAAAPEPRRQSGELRGRARLAAAIARDLDAHKAALAALPENQACDDYAARKASTFRQRVNPRTGKPYGALTAKERAARQTEKELRRSGLLPATA